MDYNLDNEKLREIDEEVDNILKEEKEDDIYFNQSKYPNNNKNIQYLFNSSTNGFSTNTLGILNSKSNINNSNQFNLLSSPTTIYDSNKNSDIYDYLIQFKEKNYSLQLKLNELNKFRTEINTKNKKISELENAITNYKYEIGKLINKNEENMKLNQLWENTFKDMKIKVNKLEEDKINLKEQLEQLKTKHDDLQFKFDIANEKSKSKDDNLSKLKKVQSEYENSLGDMKKDYKLKEENLKKKLNEMEGQFTDKIREMEKEFMNEREGLMEIIKSLEEDVTKEHGNVDALTDKLQEITFECKTKEVEHSLILEEKNKKLKEKEASLEKISQDTNNHISQFEDVIKNINEKIVEKENYYTKEIQKTEKKFMEESEKNKEYMKIINKYEENVKVFDTTSQYDKLDPEEKSRLEKEILFLKKLLTNKQIDVEKLQSDVSKTLNSLNNSGILSKKYNANLNLNSVNNSNINDVNEYNLEKELKRKNEEIYRLKMAISDLENNNRILLDEINHLKEVFQSSAYEYKCEINRKNEEIHLLKFNYDKLVDDVQDKLNHVFY